eukprot:SM005713S18739  [mRNA]  locus=s5713:357:968:+ [translate_table: standard]
MALLCSVQAAIREPALLPNLTQILDGIEAQNVHNSSSWQADYQLRALANSYADLVLNPATGDPNQPAVVIPTLRFQDVERDVMFGLSLLVNQDSDRAIDD